MAAFFADVAQVTAAIFCFSIVIIKLGQPVFLTVKMHGLKPHKNVCRNWCHCFSFHLAHHNANGGKSRNGCK